MEIMIVVGKKDFIHSHLHITNESTLNEIYEKLRKEEVLKTKLESRAKKSEADIQAGSIYTRSEIEERTANLGR